ncbi:MAG: hypothetical protein ACRD3T_19625 [Terriglobia bacterium]
MNPFESLERRKGYSLRSQSSWRKQWSLEEQAKRIALLVKICEENIVKHQKAVADMTAAAARSPSFYPFRLDEALRELEEEKRKLPVYKKQLASFQSEIAALVKPTHAKAAERVKHQAQLCKLASQRLDQDRLIGRMVTKLRRLLEQRQDLTSDMHAAASAIELETGSDNLDEKRFDALDSLPADMVSETERWRLGLPGSSGT